MGMGVESYFTWEGPLAKGDFARHSGHASFPLHTATAELTGFLVLALVANIPQLV